MRHFYDEWSRRLGRSSSDTLGKTAVEKLARVQGLRGSYGPGWAKQAGGNTVITEVGRDVDEEVVALIYRFMNE